MEAARKKAGPALRDRATDGHARPMDDELRALERRAAAGDAEADDRLRELRRRAGEPRFAAHVHLALIQAGWHEGRRVPAMVAEWERRLAEFGAMSAAANAALTEFGGLRFDLDGPGMDKARESFRLDPTLVEGECDRLGAFASVVGSLYPLGDFAHGAYFIAMAQDGQVFVLEQDIQRVGGDIVDALDRLLLGRRMDPV